MEISPTLLLAAHFVKSEKRKRFALSPYNRFHLRLTESSRSASFFNQSVSPPVKQTFASKSS